MYERIEPLAPAELGAFRRGDLLTRMVGDVDALQGLSIRGIGPPVAGLVVGAACVVATALLLPAAAVVLAAGLVVGGVAVPLLAARVAQRSARCQASARGELTAELVELLAGAPELVAYGREDETLARVRAADRELGRLAERDALVAGVADAASIAIAGLTTVSVLALAVAAHDAGTLDRVLVATLALLALVSFETVAPLPAAARELTGTLAAGRRVLELTAHEPAVRDPERPGGRPRDRPSPCHSRASPRDTRARRRRRSRASTFGSSPASASPSSARAAPGRQRSRACSCGSSTRRKGASRSPAATSARSGRRTFAACSRSPARTRTCSTRRSARTSASRGRRRATRSCTMRSQEAHLAAWVATLPDGLDTLVGEDGRRLSGGQRQRLVVARALLADAPVLLLDEPTAHLDPLTAEALVRDVLDAADGKSVLLITHRPEGLDLVDRVVTLDR